MRDRRVAIIAGVGAGLAAAVERVLSGADAKDRHVVRIGKPPQVWPEEDMRVRTGPRPKDWKQREKRRPRR
ncbi:hypothetical protein [Methylobacterium fujisawaense]